MFGKRFRDDDSYDEYYAERPQRAAREFAPLWIHIGALALIAVAALLAIWGVAGWTMVERFLKQLVAPVGLIWMGLGLLTYFAFVRRAPATAIAGLMLWLLLTCGGNLFVRQGLVRGLEREYLQTDWSQLGEFAVVLVLGGGTHSSPTGQPQLVGGGDRVLTAARMYHAGQAERLIASGVQPFRASAEELDRCQEMRMIWESLGIPLDALATIGGSNTREELLAFADWLAAQRRSGELASAARVGIVTSAWHLRRTMKLCADLGIDATPIPCDYLSRPFIPDPSVIVPSAENLAVAAKAIYEYLGATIGR